MRMSCGINLIIYIFAGLRRSSPQIYVFINEWICYSLYISIFAAMVAANERKLKHAIECRKKTRTAKAGAGGTSSNAAMAYEAGPGTGPACHR